MRSQAIIATIILLTSLCSAGDGEKVTREIGTIKTAVGSMAFSVVEEKDGSKRGWAFVSDEHVIESVLLPLDKAKLTELKALCDKTIKALDGKAK